MSKPTPQKEQPVSVEFWDGKKCHVVLVSRNCQTPVKDLIDGTLAGRWQLPPEDEEDERTQNLPV